MKTSPSPLKKIVIVGGGAGGLELATRLGRSLGKKRRAEITLVDEKAIHVWKPLLHEVAAGSLDSNIDQVNYYAHAAQQFYRYYPGKMMDLDRVNKHIILAPLVDENLHEIIPQRELAYDILVLAVGSQGNDFNIPGVSQFCLTLDDLDQANTFQREYINKILAVNYGETAQKPFNVVIVGGGATGVELAAELHRSLVDIQNYGLNNAALLLTKITIIESSPRILAALPQEVADAVQQKLENLNIHIFTDEKVTQVQQHGIHTQSGQFIAADLCVWAAGIKAPDFLHDLAGLESDHLNRLFIKPSLQTTRDDSIFVIGDCAHLRDESTGLLIPARAQAAHQQANFLTKILKRGDLSTPLPAFKFHDRGAIIALACYGAYGNLTMFNTFQHYISGKIALVAYRSLYFLHLVNVYGFWPALWFKVARAQLLKIKPRLKLHFGKH